MKCPNCNAVLEDNGLFCHECGTAIPKAEAPIMEAPRMETPMMEAPRREVADTYPSKPTTEGSFRTELAPAKKKKPVTLWLSIVFGVLALVFLGTTILFFVKYRNAQDIVASYEEKEEEAKEAKKEQKKGAGSRSTDINNAENIRMCILADIADQKYPFTEKGWLIPIEGEYCPTALGEVKTIKNKEHKGEYFLASWDPITGTCDVYDSTGEYLLTDIKGAEDYENGNPAGKYNPTVTK